jgi:protein SCO1/2
VIDGACRRARRLLAGLTLILAAALAVGAAGCTRKTDDGAAGRVLPGGSAGPGTAPDAPVLPPGGDFALSNPGATPFTLADLRGHAVVLFFGFASCPDFCPRAMATVRTARATLGAAQAARVRTVFVSVDPDRDTPAILQRYLAQFDPAAIGETGRNEDLHSAMRLNRGE